jgi:FkbM family methyltransferase
MIKLSNSVNKIFNLIVKVVDDKTKYNYTMLVDYEGSKLLIRPFILSEILMTSGPWEPYVKAILDKEVKNDDVIVDVGAHIGVYTIPLAKRATKVIAFEPHPKTSEMLDKSIKLNQLHNVMLIKKSVGNLKGKTLYSLSTVPMLSGITIPVGLVHSTIETQSIDLDTALAMESRVDWLIIDVESFEVNVLNGARYILRKYSPKIIIEIAPDNVYKVKEILKNEEYSITPLYNFYYYCYKVI